jgi:hypothetical protein
VGITLGIFDLFAYAVPGSLYLGLFTYVAVRAGWIESTWLHDGNTTLLLVSAALASYLLGHVAYALGRLTRRIPRSRDTDPREEFVRRVPAARERPFVDVDRATLLAVIQIRHPEAAVEVVRLRAAALMLSNAAPAFAVGALVALVEVFTGDPLPAAGAGVLFVLAAVAAVLQGDRMHQWANLKTLEVAFWIEGVDDAVSPPA